MGVLRQFCLIAMLTTMHFMSPSLCAAAPTRETLKGAGGRVELELSQGSILSHESVTLEVTIELPRGAVLVDPGQVQALKNWIVIHQESGRPTLTSSGGRRWHHTFLLAPTLIGKADFAGLQFSIRPANQERAMTLKVKQLSVQVKSLLPQNHKLDTLKGLREPETELIAQTSGSQFLGSRLSGALLVLTAFLVLGFTGALFVFVLIIILWLRSQRAKNSQNRHSIEQKGSLESMEGIDAHRQVMNLLRGVFSRTVTPQARSLSALELREILSNSKLPEALQSELFHFLSDYDELVFSEHPAADLWARERLARLRSQLQGLGEHRRSS